MIKITSRRIFFLCLFLFFILTAPTVVLYAFGYRFNLERGIFIYTGSISIKSSPRNINVYLNEKPITKKKMNYLNSSYNIGGIRPGEYILKIESPGYNFWIKKINVHSGISTEFWNVILTKKEYPVQNYSTENIEKFFISPDGKKIAFTTEGISDGRKEFLVKVLDLETGISKNIFSSMDYRFSREKTANIEWSPDPDQILIPVEKENEQSYFAVDIKDRQTINLKDIAQQNNFQNVRWSPYQKNSVLFMAENNLYKSDLEKSYATELISENISGYEIFSSDLIVANRQNGIIYKISPDGKSKEQITFSSIETLEKSYGKIITYDEKRIAIIDQYKNLYLYNQGDREKYLKKLSSEVQGLQFSNDGKKILYWTTNEIFVHFLRDWDAQPYRREKETKTLTRFSQKIDNVQWLGKYEHIIFSSGSSIKLIELDHRDHINMMDIVNFNIKNTQIATDASSGRLYFTDSETNSNFVNLRSIEFPEKAALLEL